MERAWWVCAVYADSAMISQNSERKRALLGAGVCNMHTGRESGRSHRIFSEFRYFPWNFRIPTWNERGGFAPLTLIPP